MVFVAALEPLEREGRPRGLEGHQLVEAIHGQPEVLGGLRIGDLAPAILLEGRDRASRLAEAPARGTSHRIDLADEIDHGSANSRERVDAEVRALVRLEALDGAQQAIDVVPKQYNGRHR